MTETEKETDQKQEAKEERNKNRIQYVASSVIGARQYQQDAYEIWQQDEEFFAVICDGMGGLNGGERASQEAVSLFVNDYQNRSKSFPLQEFLKEEVKKLDWTVSVMEDEQERPLGAGTTCVAAAILEDELYWVSVGDSKLYIIRKEEILCVTREHNYLLHLNNLLLHGQISESEYGEEIKKGAALISYLGMGNVSLWDINPNPFQLAAGDQLLLCSDGLYKALPDREIFEILKKNRGSLENAVIELQKRAEESSGTRQDNTTLVLIQYKEKEG